MAEASSPKQWGEKFLAAEVDRLVELVEKELPNAKAYNVYSLHIQVVIPGMYTDKVLKGLKDRYEKAGWGTVQFKTDFPLAPKQTTVMLDFNTEHAVVEELVHESILNEGVTVC